MKKITSFYLLFLFVAFAIASQNPRTEITLTELTVNQSSYTDSEVFIPGKTQLHLSSATAPLINSVIHLNSPDSWLVFDNIRPQQVVSQWLSSIMINGVPAVDKSNARISIYKQGTVVIPHASSLHPLTVYDGLNFSGNSQTYALHTYYKSLGTLDNKIRSFKLKRGYMATFATNSDGSGYSRCFVADHDDLEISLPELLDRKVSFIRVLTWEYVSKKGWCGWSEDDYKLMNATWHYDWNAGGVTDYLTEYVPIRQKADWPGWDIIQSKTYVSHVLGYNEPDQSDQANMNFKQIMDIWPEFMKTGLRIGSPAWANPWAGNGGNLFDFIKKCDELNYRVDFVALHCYWGGKSPQNWYNDLKYIHETTGRPLWITEWNNGANWTNEAWPDANRLYTTANAQKQLADLKGILQVLDTASFVERYSIYNWVENCRAVILNGQMTLAGEYYASNSPGLAFNKSKERIPTYKHSYTPVLQMTNTGNTKVTLTVVDPGLEQELGCVIEKKIDDGSFQILFDSNDPYQTVFSDNIDLNAGFNISYRVRTKLSNGNSSSYSAEVGYTIAQGSSVQFGNIKSSSIQWSPIFFKDPISSPVIVTGAPTNRNLSVLMSNRVKFVGSTLFNFQLAPWAYQNVTSLSQAETLSFLTANTGSYNLGNIKMVAARVTGVGPTWKDVTFATPFDDVPVVLVNQLFPITSHATTARVRNVTKTGFQVKLQKESKIITALSGELISYVALSQGEGTFDNHQIKVGLTPATIGSTSTYTISYGETIPNVVFLPQMQTCQDDTVTATLRTMVWGQSGATIRKQREVSLGYTATANNEVVGYVVIKPAQPQTGVWQQPYTVFDVYPNPVKQTLYLKLNNHEPVVVSVYNMAGVLVKQASTDGTSVDVGDLAAGYYLLRTSNNQMAKFIKHE
jgi:hypothetical protein